MMQSDDHAPGPHKKQASFSSTENDSPYAAQDEEQGFDDEHELIVYMDENRHFNRHRNHYQQQQQQKSPVMVDVGSNDAVLDDAVDPSASKSSSRKRRSSVWVVPSLTKNNFISSIEAKVANTVEFDFKKKSAAAVSEPMTGNEGKYIGYVIETNMGFNNDGLKCQWSVVRRYNEFKKFHNLIKKCHPNKDVFFKVRFPSKSPITSYNDQSLLEYRKKAFSDYLALIIEIQNDLRKTPVSPSDEGRKKQFDFLIYYFLDVHNSPLSFLFDHPYTDIYAKVGQFYQTTREEKRKFKRIIEMEKNYDEEKQQENGLFILREQEWYENKFLRIELLNKELNELRLNGDDFFVELKGKPHILTVDKLSSALQLYLLSENSDGLKIDHTFMRQIYIETIVMMRELNNTYRGDGFEVIDMHLSNGETLQFHAFDRKELIYTIGAHLNQYKQSKSKLIAYLTGTVHKLKKERYDETNHLHETDLLTMYNLVKPDEPLISRKTKQWVEIGFQGDNPSTDFRGGGYMSLKMLLYFAQNDTELMKLLISHQRSYPFCVSGINLFSILCNLVNLDNLTSSSVESLEDKFPMFRFMCLQIKNGIFPDAETVFGSMFILLCKVLDKLWADENAGYMDYQNIIDKTRRTIEKALDERPNDLRTLESTLGL